MSTKRKLILIAWAVFVYVSTITLGWWWVLGLSFPLWKVAVVGFYNYAMWNAMAKKNREWSDEAKGEPNEMEV